MNVAKRRAEIINTLMVRRFVTAKELAEEFEVSIRTIENDIYWLGEEYPVYTKQGCAGGIYLDDKYAPYNNTLSKAELDLLLKLRDNLKSPQKDVLTGIIIKYGSSEAKKLLSV